MNPRPSLVSSMTVAVLLFSFVMVATSTGLAMALWGLILFFPSPYHRLDGPSCLSLIKPAACMLIIYCLWLYFSFYVISIRIFSFQLFLELSQSSDCVSSLLWNIHGSSGSQGIFAEDAEQKCNRRAYGWPRNLWDCRLVSDP